MCPVGGGQGRGEGRGKPARLGRVRIQTQTSAWKPGLACVVSGPTRQPCPQECPPRPDQPLPEHAWCSCQLHAIPSLLRTLGVCSESGPRTVATSAASAPGAGSMGRAEALLFVLQCTVPLRLTTLGGKKCGFWIRFI